MFEECNVSNAGPKCSEVAEKLVQLFGWRQTYNVEKLQRNVPARTTARISITRPSPDRAKPKFIESVDSWVQVHNLQTQGGGILDPDDRLSDVADDREQIIATFEDGDRPHHHGGGDGASGSSVGTGSPDIFHDGEHKYGPSYPRTDIEVTGEQIASGVPGALQVRRGSEPALNQLPAGPPAPADPTKRWSAAPLIIEPPAVSYLGPTWADDSREEDEEPEFRRIARDGSNRLSMQFLGDGAGGYRWAEAAERAANTKSHTSLPRDHKRKEPLGQANSTSPVSTLEKEKGELIVIRNEPGPLGIHVVPQYDMLGKDRGLLVKGIEPGGRIDRDGRLAMFDRIVEINGKSLINMPFQRVQEMFKLSLTSPELRLRVVKSSGIENINKPPPPVYPRFPEDKENVSMVECEQKPESTNTKVATVSPTKKLPPSSRNPKSLLSANTRKIGRKIEIELKKGPHGLGFSITTRDNPAGGNCPIYIKNIIPKGAAVEDGRLKIGDRLLEVNGVEMTGKSQSEAVALLREAPAGSTVRIVVSRQEDVIEPTLPRIIGVDEAVEQEEERNMEVRKEDIPPTIPPLPQSHLHPKSSEKGSSVAKIISQFQEAANISNPHDKTEEGSTFPWKHREFLTLNIPVHDSEKAGLGISVKGKTSGSQDLGIFIKSVINGGAASRDKRLRTNDQLLNVNGISLLHQTNSEAMETLRNAMLHTEGPVPGNITLTIARRASSPGPNRSFDSRGSDPNLLNSTNNSSNGLLCYSNGSDASLTENSGASGSSTNTVIFNPHKSPSEAAKSPSTNQSFNNSIGPMNTWNPVLDRLMGNNSNKQQQLRNESYYKATNDTWNATMFSPNQSMGNNISSTTISLPSGEPILIEDEYGSRLLQQHNMRTKAGNSIVNIKNNIMESRKDHEPDGKASLTGSMTNDKSTEGSVVANNDATYASQLSLENPAGFSRDAFGRQSMSEKRHATLDAKNTDTYQRSKKMREERDKKREANLVRVGSVESVVSINRSSEHPEYADKLGQLGPSLGMKKSSSLESLQTMVQEIQMQEESDPAYSYRGPGGLKVIRGKGCEESFRAAVDPNHRTEVSAKKHWLLDPPIDYDQGPEGFNNVRGGPRQSSLNAALDAKHKTDKKKPGILKGIGSMFRFGKHRKMDFPNIDGQQYQHHHAEQVQVIPEGSTIPPPVRYRNNNSSVDQTYSSRDRTQQIKTHEQRLAQRHTYYVPEDRERENFYEQRPDQNGNNGNLQEYGRPGSRSGITESVPFTHYVNYNELQTHLSRKDQLSDSQIVQMRMQVQQQRLKVEEESRKQHQYHSQRQPRQESQLRPVSNFYEYESVQAILNTRGRPPPMPIPPPSQPNPYQMDPNSNSLPRIQGPQPSRSRNPTPNNHMPHRGPFVTQVTIGEQVHQNGTKV